MLDAAATAWLAAVLLAGCDWAFSLSHLDAPLPDAPACPLESDAFDGPGVCDAWGYPLSAGSHVERIENGELVLLPGGSTPNNTGCVSRLAFPFELRGANVEVTAVGAGAAQYNSLIAFWGGDTADGTMIGASVTTIGLRDASGMMRGSAPYDPVAMRWWRLRPSDDRSEVIAELSPDGHAWTELGRDPRPAPATLKVQIQSGVYAPTTPTPMRVASFDACP